MDFFEDYPRLESAQQERFKRVVTRLLAGEILTPGSPLEPDPDWRFAERFRELIDCYLRIGGWGFDLDSTLRLGRAAPETRAPPERFSQPQSLARCMLPVHLPRQNRLAGQENPRDTTVGLPPASGGAA